VEGRNPSWGPRVHGFMHEVGAGTDRRPETTSQTRSNKKNRETNTARAAICLRGRPWGGHATCMSRVHVPRVVYYYRTPRARRPQIHNTQSEPADL
jgi:hypothetical protein